MHDLIIYLNEMPEMQTKLELHNLCESLLGSGSRDVQIFNENTNTLKAIALNVLEKIKETLMTMYDAMLVLLDKYLMNVAAVSNRYKDMILRIPEERINAVQYIHYEYPHFDDMPKFDLPKSYEFEKNPKDIDISKFKLEIDKLLQQEAKKIFDTAFPSVIEFGFGQRFNELCYEKLQGNPKVEMLTKKKLETILNDTLYLDSTGPKELRSKIKKDRVTILEAYDSLRKHISDDLNVTTDAISGKVLMKFKDSEVELNDSELGDMNRNFMEVNRFYSTMMQLYDIAFKAKLDIHKNRIIRHQELLRQLLDDESVSKKIVNAHIQDINTKMDYRKNNGQGQ